jgi:hypothetical protein
VDYENDEENEDNISVTGSEGNDRKSPLISGAFTSLIQKNHAKMKEGLELLQNPGQYSNLSQPLQQSSQIQQPQFNLAAQLFFQNPLIPQPNHWLYNQLYGQNYHEFPWLRPNFFANNGGSNNNGEQSMNLIKRSITLISNNRDNDDDEDDAKRKSPSVTSTKRSPSPASPPRSDSVSSGVTKIEKPKLKKFGPIEKSRQVKQGDVWRPY